MTASSPAGTAPQAPRVFRLDDGQGTSIAVSDLGATWLSCRVPLADGSRREVLLGRPCPAEHVSQGGYVGAVVGRYANRIAGARFVLAGVEYRLAANEGDNQLHGGPGGFHCRTWQLLEQGERHLLFGLHSPDGDQGFPGNLQAQVRYTIEGPGRIALEFQAEVDRPCPVNLTSHAYFNLDGDADPAHTIATHRISIAANHWLPVDSALIPTGEIAPVEGTTMDLRTPRAIGDQRFDHCYVLDAHEPAAATVWSGDGRLRMQLFTDAPGVQFYGGHFLPGSTDRLGRPYASGAGFAMEPQHWPDSPNRPDWPDHRPVLHPPAVLRRHMRLHFEPT